MNKGDDQTPENQNQGEQLPKPEVEKMPRKNKQSWTAAKIGGVSAGVAAVGTFVAGVGLERAGKIDVGASQKRHVKVDSDGDGKPEDWIILHEKEYYKNHPLDVAKTLRNSGTVDKAKIRKELGLEAEKKGLMDENKIIPRNEAFIPFNDLGPLIPGIEKMVSVRNGSALESLARGQSGRRENIAARVYYENLLDKAVGIFAQTDEGKALIEKKKHNPRDVLIEHFDYIQNVSAESMKRAGLTKEVADLSEVGDTEAKYIYEGLKTPEKDDERAEKNYTSIVKLALDMFSRLNQHLKNVPEEDVVERLRVAVENKAFDKGQEALLRGMIILDGGPFASKGGPQR